MALKTLTTDRLVIDGKLVEPESRGTRTLINPATGGNADVVPEGTAADVTRAVAAAKAAFDDGRWSKIGPSARSAAIYKLADLIEQHLDDLAALESGNVGKPMKLAHDSDLPFAIDCLRFFAGAARTLDGRASQRVRAWVQQYHPPRANRRLRPACPVELSADDGDVENRPGVGRWQHRRAQARAGDTTDHTGPWRTRA